MKKIWIAVVAVVIVAVVGLGSWWAVDRNTYAGMVASSKDVKKWTADTKPLQSNAAVEKQLNRLTQATKADKDLMATQATIVIPGLRGAWSINHKTGKAEFGTDWVPQGVTQSGFDFYISMYDGKHKLNSIITQVSQDTGKYVKTLILNSTSHVGAITYDTTHKRLIWSDDNGKPDGAGFGYANQNTIDTYQASVAQAPIESNRIKWALGHRTSAMTLYNNQLIIVKYGAKKSQHSIVAVSLNKQGLPNPVSSKEMKAAIAKAPTADLEKDPLNTGLKQLIKDKIIDSYTAGWNRMQGVAIAKNGVTLISQSNGEHPGKIFIRVPEGGGWSNLKFKKPTIGATEVNVPNSVEQVSLTTDGQLLSMAFESGARQYRESGSFLHRNQFMDRLLVLGVKVE
ncbi:hypothetical protein FC34_GL001861 [Lacticaseibacillus brantae DSM 23927]|uniref:Uncharacterized protein n=2 Tax=Lacticaseibacillus brantae TaxID=943673 RepID=A0A0R2AXI0_9LACO|nr:hypothetical protein FC34_GL001861 [Lacticaseibacillus brantae DSM 23927]